MNSPGRSGCSQLNIDVQLASDIKEEAAIEEAEAAIDLSPSHIPSTTRLCSSCEDQLAGSEVPHVVEPANAQALEEVKRLLVTYLQGRGSVLRMRTILPDQKYQNLKFQAPFLNQPHTRCCQRGCRSRSPSRTRKDNLQMFLLLSARASS